MREGRRFGCTTMASATDSDAGLAALMAAAQAGDIAAYQRLLKEITPRVRSVVRQSRRFFQPQDVEDLVQETLLSLHAVRATYDPKRPFMPWLMAITRNRLADGARRYARRTLREASVEPVTFSDVPANRDAEEYRDPEALRQAIVRLPLRQRQAIEMLKLREMSLKDASVATGTSIGALKVSVHRAVANLRRLLTNA